MAIDINKVEEDVMEEYIAPENEQAKDMLDRLSRKILGKSAQELYLEWVLNEIKAYQNTPQSEKNPSMEANYLKFLAVIDNIMWLSKDKRDIKITTALKSAKDIFDSTKI